MLRECFVDGPVSGNTLDKLFFTRAQFISSTYKVCTQAAYFKDTVPEIKKIQQIPKDVAINLWFEEDLFCQVNFWFTVHLLNQSQIKNTIYLIQPQTHNQYGFGGLDTQELTAIYNNKKKLSKLDKLATLWSFYQKDNQTQLLKAAQELAPIYPFILKAVKAHIERIPTKTNVGRPSACLLQIIKDLNTHEFAPIFKEFSKREPMYGFGDLQVKRLLDAIINKS